MDVTIILPLKGQQDVRRYLHILRPSLDGITGCKLLIITDESFDPLPSPNLEIRVISDSCFDLGPLAEYKGRGWYKQQAIKLLAWQFVDTPWMLTMDADCLFLFKGSIKLLMPQGLPFLSWATPSKVKNQTFVNHKLIKIREQYKKTPNNEESFRFGIENWWTKASRFLGKPKPEIRCQVTPMFLQRKICKNLCESHDIAKYIDLGATEYTLYWTFGGDINDYTKAPLVLPPHKGWITEEPIKAAQKIFHSAGLIGLLQSTSEIINKDIDLVGELIKVYNERP